jgi:membrane protein insertase Oxa1/YidC/SpoIIIJ
MPGPPLSPRSAQVESTVAIQALQPRVKELQAKYANDQETLQLETARLYRDAGGVEGYGELFIVYVSGLGF